MVVNLVTQVVCGVPIVDGLFGRHVLLVERRLVRCEGHQRLLLVSVVEMSILEELDTVGVEHVLDWNLAIESTILLRLTAEPAIAGLEVRACDVAHGELVEALVDTATCFRHILELHLRRDCRVEVVIAGNLDRGCVVILLLIALGLVSRRCLQAAIWAIAERILCLREPVLIVGHLWVLVSSELIVCLHRRPGQDLSLAGRLGSHAVGGVCTSVLSGLLTEAEVLLA